MSFDLKLFFNDNNTTSTNDLLSGDILNVFF